jgi:N-acetylmuramoyl-L-alanine amidase
VSRRSIITILIIAFIFFIPMIISWAAHDEVKLNVFVDFKSLELDMQPTVLHEQVMVPLSMLEQLGLRTSWDNSLNQVVIENEQSQLEFKIQDPKATWNGSSIELVEPPVIINSSPYLPLQSITERFALTYFYHEDKRELYMYTQQRADPFQAIPGLPTVDVPTINLPQVSIIEKIELTESGLSVEAASQLSNPTIRHSKDPNRIVLDFPKATLDSSLFDKLTDGLSVQTSSNPYVTQYRFAQVQMEPTVVRVVIELNEPMRTRVEPSSSSAGFQMLLEEPRYTVVIDPGHGGKDPGNIAYSGKYEKLFTLAFSQKIKEALAAYTRITVIMTRTDDTFIPLEQRASIANEQNADFFLSIHGNAYEDSSADGTETYYTYNYSKEIAQLLHNEIVKVSGFRDRGFRYNDYKVIRLTKMPAVLIETGYQSNQKQELIMNDSAFQEKLAKSIAQVIATYLEKHEGEKWK